MSDPKKIKSLQDLPVNQKVFLAGKLAASVAEIQQSIGQIDVSKFKPAAIVTDKVTPHLYTGESIIQKNDKRKEF